MVAGAWTPLVLVAFGAAPPGSAGLSPEDARAEKVVSAAGLATDGDSLLAFFRRRTLSEAERQRLVSLVRRLGDDSYEVRSRASAELTAAGVNAAPFLKTALNDSDLEVARRAELCLAVLQRGPGPELPTAAAHLLGSRKPPGTAEVLLGYIPFADDEGIEDAVLSALVEVGVPDGPLDPAFRKALTDADPARRAAAVSVVGQTADSRQRQAAFPLLRDPSAKVRFQAARTLFGAGEREAVPALLALLTDGTPEVAWQAEELLARLADNGGPGVYLDTTTESGRRQGRAAWEAWWKTNQDKFDPARAKSGPRTLGLTLIADLDNGTVFALDPGRKERWRVAGLKGPVDVQLLPNGNLLVAENHARKVTERDRAGKVVWEKTTSTLPASCQRLPNGNTFIATYNQVLEVTPSGHEVVNVPRPEGLYCARRLRNGHVVLVTTVGRVITLDPSGKEVKSFDTGGVINWSSVEVLPNGHVLVCCSSGKVVEFDPSGRRVWECHAPNAVCAQRLPNGNTLLCVSEGHRVTEVDRAGKEVWGLQVEGRPWYARRR